MKRVRAAFAALITDTEEKTTHSPEFLKAYRLWTRSIVEMGQKGWPGVNWSDLEKVV